MSETTYLLTEAELTRIMAACWQSGKMNAFPFSLGDDGERIVLGAVVVANREGYADLAIRRDVLRQAIGQGRSTYEAVRADVARARVVSTSPFTDLMLTLFGGSKP